MKEVLFLFCLLVENFLVTGNPLTQIVPAIQACPQTCNQNAFQNPTYYINPNYQAQNNFNQNANYQSQNINQNANYQGQNINIPVLLQTPTQQVQNIPVVQNTAPVISQPNNNQLYQQQLMLQNQLATPVVNNQFANPVNQLSQMYMNKILSNPTIQTLLEPNSNLIYQNGPECPKHTNHIPNPVQNQPTTPTVVNNYFLLPPEFLNPDNENFKPKNNLNEPKRSREQKRERDVNNKRSPDQMRRPHHDVEQHPDVKRNHAINPDCPVHSRKESHKRSDKLIDEDMLTHSMEERERNKMDREDKERKRRKQHGRNHDREWESHTPPEHHLHQRLHPERHHSGDILRYHEGTRPHNEGPRPHNEGPRPYHEGSRRHYKETKRPNIIIKIKERPKQSSTEIQSKGNSIEKSAEDLNQSRSGKRHSKDEELLEDFKRKFPAIPEELVRKLLSYLRRQLQKQQLGDPQFYYPDVSFPLRYDQLFPHAFTNDRSDKKRRPNRRLNKKQKNKNHSNTNLIETTTNIDYLTNTIPTTTERSIIIKDSNENLVSLDTKTTNDDQTTTAPKEFDTTTNSFPELGTEDTMSDISNGIIDDYYPDFTQDKTYFESGEAFNIRNLRDNRYHYTTDRNYKPKHNLKDIEEVIAKPFQDKIETTSSKYEVETEIRYRTPPSLESPDFITKQIVRHKPNSDKNISYKSSTYSDAKNPKNNGKNKGIKKAKPDIQTVYAHSKVVKYGKVNDDNEENVTPVVTYYLPDNMQYEDDGKTVIVAKRIPADHFWK